MTASDKRSRKEMTCKHATDRPTDRLSNQPTDRPYVRIMWRCMLLMFRLLSFLLLYVFVGLLFFAYDCFFFCFCCYNFLWELNVSANLIQIINCLFICFVYIVYFCIMSRWMFAWHILFQGEGLEIFFVFSFSWAFKIYFGDYKYHHTCILCVSTCTLSHFFAISSSGEEATMGLWCLNEIKSHQTS